MGDIANERAPGIPAQGDMLRFITCGSVDDGKSTLIGRLLIEAQAVYEDQLASLLADSAKHGTTSDEIDAALLVDGLEDERQQGITIDVAYRYFATDKRKFIIADTPGHEQFTRNMATGASTADLAILLVDASKGILTQTKRHAFLVSLLGIKHAILAVNKMDLVDYSQDVFEKIKRDFTSFATKLDLPDVRFVPLSALKGDNVAQPSAKMLWYTGGSLLNLLESIYVASDQNLRDFRFPVQWVNRPDASFRGFSGTVVSGAIRVGDEVSVLPSRKQTRVRRIVHPGGDSAEAGIGKSTTIVLEDEIDISRGDMLARPGNLPNVASRAEAMLVWMSEDPLTPNRPYWCKHTTKKLTAQVDSLRYAIDVNTLHRAHASTLNLNQIGLSHISFSEPICYDDYRQNRKTGSFILVDKITNETVAAGMLVLRGRDSEQADLWDDDSVRLTREPYLSLISAESRVVRYGQQPFTILITGLCGAGKTTLAQRLEKKLFESGRISIVLDGGDLRSGINRDLGYTAEERSENLRRAAELAKLANRAGQICVAAFVAPQKDIRTKVRDLIGPEQFFHVHLATPIDECRRRDTSGQYDAADRGEIANFPGISAAYDEPDNADLVLQTDKGTPEVLAAIVLAAVKEQGLIC